METAISLKDLAMEVGLAIRRPEQLVQRWHNTQGRTFVTLIVLLLANAIGGTAAYGLIMQAHQGTLAMLQAAVLMPLAAGSAWLMALPALYIFNSAFGSRLHLAATILAASITVCFGAWALLASVPLTWFFSLALPYASMRLLVNLTVFVGVGICMTDVFLRVLQTLEPQRSSVYGYVWVGLLGIIGAELFTLFGVFAF